MSLSHSTVRFLTFPLLALLLAACEEEPVEQVERVRAIKPYYVVEPAGGDVRRYSGTVTAANRAELSFAVSGTVQSIRVNKGDRVVKGQLLATLDPKALQLDVDATRSQQASAQAEFNNKKVELDRQRELYQKGWIAKAALDQAVAAYESSEGALNLARSRLGLAERDLSKARLTAPFDGVIAERSSEPFTEVSKGQAIFKLDSQGAMEVDLSIPDTIVGRLTVGAPVTVDTTTIAGCGCAGRITEIGSTATAANAVTVTAAILENPEGLLPGTAVEATVVLSDNGGARGFLVPLVAIVPGDDKARGYVFKFDPTAKTVRKVAIEGAGNVSGNLIGITNGVSAGDILAGAGVSFLRDGQRVKLLGE